MFTDAKDAIDWIHGARYKGQKNGLENTRALLAALNHPEKRFHMAHIAGTNGKGSTAAFTERALRAAGYRTGMYTSPYLIRYNERVQVGGVPISDAALVDIVNLLVEKAGNLVRAGIMPTTFELGTALAFEYFARMGVDVAVVEVGLGGRFDSTNVITPEVSMIAAIGRDHIRILGDTVEEIAFEKAGIIKPGIPVVVQDQPENILNVFRKAATERGAPLTIAKMPEIAEETLHGARFFLDGTAYRTTMNGRHQLLNASLAIGGLHAMGVPDVAIRHGIAWAKWPCRLEWVKGALIDGAHNPQGAHALRGFLERFFPGDKITLTIGMMNDKQMAECAKILAPVCERVIATAVDEPRAATPETIANLYRGLGVQAVGVEGIEEAVRNAMCHDGVKVFAGSLYIAGAVRQVLAGDDCFPLEK